MMSELLFHVDAFTDQPFSGNPAAVCLLTQPRDAAWMQAVAAEMNLSETAFLVPVMDGDGYDLRWFTPTTEVALCGHATLASAHMLWETGHLASTQLARFYTQSGLLTAERQGEWIVLDFPAVSYEPTTISPYLEAVPGAMPVAVSLTKGGQDCLVELADEATVCNLKPDLARLQEHGLRGMIVTSRASTPEYDIISRYFAPGWGIPEDPVTGSAHCVLGPYWSERLDSTTLRAYQASARGGTLRVQVEQERVKLAGQAVTVLHGTMLASTIV